MNNYTLYNGFSQMVLDYSTKQYGRDYDFILGLSYKWIERNWFKCRTYINRLYKNLNNKGWLDGIYVIEYDKNGSLHSHSVITTDLDYGSMKNHLNRYWGGRMGVYHLEPYIPNGGMDYYMSKFYSTSNFDFDLIQSSI